MENPYIRAMKIPKSILSRVKSFFGWEDEYGLMFNLGTLGIYALVVAIVVGFIYFQFFR